MRFVWVIFKMVRSRGLEPPRVAPPPPQGGASTNSAMTAFALAPALYIEVQPSKQPI